MGIPRWAEIILLLLAIMAAVGVVATFVTELLVRRRRR
jgi:hypothetical protein